MKYFARALVLALAFLVSPAAGADNFCKGMTHVHTFWSDGNDFPESVFLLYQRAGYCLLVSTEHNKLATFSLLGALPTSDQWVSNGWISGRPYLDGGALSAYLDAAGADRVVYDASGDGGVLVPSFASTKRWIEGLDGGMWIVPGEEISTNTAGGLEVHMNAWGISAAIAVVDGGASTAAVMALHTQRARDAGMSAEAGLPDGSPVVVVNHPNWGDAAVPSDWQDLDVQFLEIVSGHDYSASRGGSNLLSVTRQWDQVNWRRNVTTGRPFVWGVGNDDAHNYWGDQADRSCKSPDCGTTSMFRAWNMIRHDGSPNESELLASLVAGDFYVSTGASFTTLAYSGGCMTLVAGATDKLKVYGVTRAAGADSYGTTENLTACESASGSVTACCPDPSIYAFARAVACNAAGQCAWTQPMDL